MPKPRKLPKFKLKFKLNNFQRKELARVSFDVAKSMFLIVVGGYFIPPLVGFEESVD